MNKQVSNCPLTEKWSSNANFKGKLARKSNFLTRVEVGKH